MLRAMPDDRARALLCVLYYQGLRLAEARELPRKAVDFDKSRITVGRHSLPLHDRTEYYLRKACHGHEGKRRPLFPYSTRELSELLRRCRDVAPRGCITHYGSAGFHVFRRSFVAMVLEYAEAPTHVLAEILRVGHGTAVKWLHQHRSGAPAGAGAEGGNPVHFVRAAFAPCGGNAQPSTENAEAVTCVRCAVALAKPEGGEESATEAREDVTRECITLDLFGLMLRVQEDDRARAFLCLQYFHGLRVYEARTLERGALDVEAGMVTLPGGGKGGEGPRVPLHFTALQYVRNVLTAEGGPARFERWPFGFTRGEMANILRRCEAIAPKRFKRPNGGGAAGFHVFRHSFAAYLLDEGVTLEEAARLLRVSPEGARVWQLRQRTGTAARPFRAPLLVELRDAGPDGMTARLRTLMEGARRPAAGAALRRLADVVDPLKPCDGNCGGRVSQALAQRCTRCGGGYCLTCWDCSGGMCPKGCSAPASLAAVGDAAAGEGSALYVVHLTSGKVEKWSDVHRRITGDERLSWGTSPDEALKAARSGLESEARQVLAFEQRHGGTSIRTVGEARAWLLGHAPTCDVDGGRCASGCQVGTSGAGGETGGGHHARD